MSAPPAQVTTLPLPAAPANVVATVDSSTQVTVTWSENIPTNGLPIKYYFLDRGTSPSGLTKLATRAASPFVDTGDSPNPTYYYEIEAIDTSYDVSPMSATAQV